MTVTALKNLRLFIINSTAIGDTVSRTLTAMIDNIQADLQAELDREFQAGIGSTAVKKLQGEALQKLRESAYRF